MVPLVVFLVVPVLPVVQRERGELADPGGDGAVRHAALAAGAGDGGVREAVGPRQRGRCGAAGRGDAVPGTARRGAGGVHDVRVCPRAREGLVGEEDVFREVPQAQLRVLAHGAEPIRDADGPALGRIPLGQSGLGAVRSVSPEVKKVLEVLITAAELHRVALLHAGGVGVKGHHADPGLVPVAPCNHAAVPKGPDGHQVVLSTRHDVLAVGAPAHAQQASKVAFHGAVQLHRVKVEHPQEAVLAHTRQELAIWGESKLVEGPLAHRPFEERVPRGFALASVHGKALPLLQELVVGGCGATSVLHIIQVHAPTRVGY